MAVIIGNACIDERGKASGGNAGDQTGKEVKTQVWYSHPWHTVFRPNSSKIADIIAKTMEDACNNKNIGYDQSQRTTLYNLASKNAWNIKNISSKCETDCSALVSVCVNAAGITVSKDMYTGNEEAVLKNTGKFTILKDKKYTTSPNLLKRGDILLGNGHTAIVISNSSKTEVQKPKTEVIKAKEVAKNKLKQYEGTYVTLKSVNIRDGAGIRKPKLTTLKQGAKVKCYGYYNKSKAGNTWLYVEVVVGSKTYIGYVAYKRLKKK